MMKPLEEGVRDTFNIFMNYDNIDYVLYLGASIAGEIYGIPAVQTFEEYEKLIRRNSGDSTSDSFEKQLKNN
jgi:hypothetical protein